MQFRLDSAILLFLGSYLPLALILLVQDVPKALWGAPLCTFDGSSLCTYQLLEHPWLSLGAVVATLFCVVRTMQVIKSVTPAFAVQVHEVRPVPNDLINYVFPYVVSFMGLSYSEPQKLAGFAVFLIALFVITYKSGQILMNPLLIVLGWQLYEVKMTLGQAKVSRVARVLKRGKLLPGPQRAEKIQDVYLMGDL